MNEIIKEDKYEQELDYPQLLLQQVNRISMISSTCKIYSRENTRILDNAVRALESLLSPYLDTQYREAKKKIQTLQKELKGYHNKEASRQRYFLLIQQWQELMNLMSRCGLLLAQLTEEDMEKTEK